MRRSKVHGKGLFATRPFPAGHRFGRVWGRVTGRGHDATTLQRLARGHTRTLLLTLQCEHVLVDVTGSPYEWLNGAATLSGANVRFTPGGYVETTMDVDVVVDLLLLYGDAFVL